MKNDYPLAIQSADTPARTLKSVYPEPLASMMEGREKHVLGDLFGIKKFGVNLTHLAPGARSALLHRHSDQEEFIFILSGHPTLVTESGELTLEPGMCAGFIPEGRAHYLINRTDVTASYLEMGDRCKNDTVTYPQDDLKATLDAEAKWVFTHSDGKPY